MTKIEQDAIAQFKQLPDAARAELARLMSDYAGKHSALRRKLSESAEQLDAGLGSPADRVFSDLRVKYGN